VLCANTLSEPVCVVASSSLCVRQLSEDGHRQRAPFGRIRPGAELIQKHERGAVGPLEDLPVRQKRRAEGAQVLLDGLIVPMST